MTDGAVEAGQVLRLGGHVLDLGRGLLLDAAGMPVALRPQALKVLLVLGESANRPVDKETLMSRVWAGVVVTDDSLVQAVGDARQVLGEGGREMLRTLPRRGYMLVPAEEARGPGVSVVEAQREMERLGDRLRREAAGRFVGRERELAALGPAVGAAMPGEAVLYFVHGPGGMGKSSLLERLRSRAQAGVEAVVLNGAELMPTPEGVLGAVAGALALREWDGSAESLSLRWSQRGRGVLLVDTFEALEPVQGWMREVWLPSLPSQVTVVLAGRRAPDSRWTAHPLWGGAMRVVGLESLGHEDAERLARAHGASGEVCGDLARRCHGHPLALVLLAGEVARTGRLPEVLGGDLVQALTRRCMEQVPDALHREALVVCALARHGNRELLAGVVSAEHGERLFDWLCAQPHVRLGRDGLRLHDLMRDVVMEDMRWRDRERFRQLRHGVLRFLCSRVGARRDTWDAAVDFFFARRKTPSLAAYFRMEGLERLHAGPATPREHPALLELAAHELPASEVAHLRRWLGHPAAEAVVVREDDGTLCGAMLRLRLDRLIPPDFEADEVLAGVRALVGGEWNEPGGGTFSSLTRQFFVSGGFGSPGKAQTALCTHSLGLFSDPGLRLWISVVPEADFLMQMMMQLESRPLAGSEAMIPGLGCRFVVRDWQADPLAGWLDRLIAPLERRG